MLDRLRDGVLEMPAQVADCLGLDLIHPRDVGFVVGAKLLSNEEVSDLLWVLKVQTVPVDDRVASQDETNGFEVGECKLVERFESIGRIRLDQALSVVWFEAPAGSPGA
jgi:hypothetical protein